MISAERDRIGIFLISHLHFFNTKYTLVSSGMTRSPCGFRRLTCFTKATPCTSTGWKMASPNWCSMPQDRSINSTLRPSPASARRWTCWKSKQI
ncbi:hypothetical protein CKO_00189 [Citrobacter koseri ATCC BAA-895]|uniref:Uncharacterized protein n=1 Tax=Citrobacter koseri (strain ATCC BAA-895 / CDC 4225-83 / SGSC4696) TaxID=290338 RepID=A8ACZ5_CITK8|nr:hypothetical protein CKO_00189 [Citrobacter koseri ATCC BAA-895]